MQTYLYFASILLTCALTGWLAFYAWRQPGVPGARAYAGLAFSECLLALAEILSMLSQGQSQALFWFNVRIIFIAVIPVFWLVFALTYFGQKGWLSRRLLLAVSIIPVLTQIFVWSNNVLGLWVKQEVRFHQSGIFWIAQTSTRIPGLWFLVHSFYSLFLLLAGIILILITAWKKQHLYKAQAILLSAGAIIALCTSIIPLFNLIPQAEFNPFIPGIGASALLYALGIFRFQFLRRAPAFESIPGSPIETLEKRSQVLFMFIFIAMAAGIAAIGYLSYQNYERNIRSEVESQLSSTAALKVKGLQGWRNERLADAETFHRNPSFSALVQRFLENPENTQAHADLQAWLEAYAAYNQYDRLFLLDTQGVERISSPTAFEPVESHIIQEIGAILSKGEVTFLDFHRDTNDGAIHLSLLVPIMSVSDHHSLGILVMRIDPELFLYPFIQEWPVPSTTAETLLVRKEGTDALFLNKLKFEENTALNLHIPLANTEIAAVKAVLGQVGIVEALDYRDIPVIADIRPVPDSPWFLVSRIDKTEVYAPLRARLWQTLFLFGVLAVAAGAELSWIWRQQRTRYAKVSKEAGETIRESDRKLKEAQAMAHLGFWYWDIKTGDVEWSEQVYSIFRLNPNEFTPHIDSILALSPWPEDHQRDQELINRALESHEPGFYEQKFLRPDLSVGYYSSSFQGHYDENGVLISMVGSVLDITERKLNEAAQQQSGQKFRDIVANLDEGYYSVTVEGTLLEHNPAYNRILGLPADKDLRGTATSDFWLNPDDRREYLKALSANGSVSSYQVTAKKQTGEAITILISAHLVQDLDNLPLRIEGVILDISERKQHEEQILANQAELKRLLAQSDKSRRILLNVIEDHKMAEEQIRILNNELEQRVRERTAQLENANKELEAFSYSVSHDLRAPLRGIDGWSHILLDENYDQLNEQGRESLNFIRSETQRMGLLIENLLQLSRVSRTEMRRDLVDLTRLAHAIMARLQSEQKCFSMKVIIQPGLTATGDTALLEIVLTNLLSNAMKFTCARPNARVEVGQTEEPGQHAFFVRDNGVGFDMAYAQKLFGVFQRMHRATEFAGTGIGLAIVQRIVHRHGGQVWAEAQVDNGATFYFTIEELE